MLTQGKGTRDYNRFKTISQPDFLKFQDKLISSLHLTYSSYRDFVAIYTTYKSTGIGLRPYGLVNYFEGNTGSYRALHQRLALLQDKGLITKLSTTYIPTDKAIQLLNSITV